MAQFYSQQAYGLWPQVWPVPEEKVIKGYEQFLYRLMFVICTVFAVTFIIKKSKNPFDSASSLDNS